MDWEEPEVEEGQFEERSVRDDFKLKLFGRCMRTPDVDDVNDDDDGGVLEDEDDDDEEQEDDDDDCCDELSTDVGE